MAEAPTTLAQAHNSTKAFAAQAKLRATMIQATRTIALQRALGLTKLRLRAKGFRVSDYTRRELVTHAEQYLAAHREELIAEAKQIAEQWRRNGFLGKRAVHITPIL